MMVQIADIRHLYLRSILDLSDSLFVCASRSILTTSKDFVKYVYPVSRYANAG